MNRHAPWSKLNRVVAPLALVLLLAAAAQAAPGLQAVWAVDDGEKVFQDDLDHPLKSGGAGNSVWDGATIGLFGARNEIVAFQVILEANSEGAQAISVPVSDLVGNKGGVIGPRVDQSRCGWIRGSGCVRPLAGQRQPKGALNLMLSAGIVRRTRLSA